MISNPRILLLALLFILPLSTTAKADRDLRALMNLWSGDELRAALANGQKVPKDSTRVTGVEQQLLLDYAQGLATEWQELLNTRTLAPYLQEAIPNYIAALKAMRFTLANGFISNYDCSNLQMTSSEYQQLTAALREIDSVDQATLQQEIQTERPSGDRIQLPKPARPSGAVVKLSNSQMQQFARDIEDASAEYQDFFEVYGTVSTRDKSAISYLTLARTAQDSQDKLRQSLVTNYQDQENFQRLTELQTRWAKYLAIDSVLTNAINSLGFSGSDALSIAKRNLANLSVTEEDLVAVDSVRNYLVGISPTLRPAQEEVISFTSFAISAMKELASKPRPKKPRVFDPEQSASLLWKAITSSPRDERNYFEKPLFALLAYREVKCQEDMNRIQDAFARQLGGDLHEELQLSLVDDEMANHNQYQRKGANDFKRTLSYYLAIAGCGSTTEGASDDPRFAQAAYKRKQLLKMLQDVSPPSESELQALRNSYYLIAYDLAIRGTSCDYADIEKPATDYFEFQLGRRPWEGGQRENRRPCNLGLTDEQCKEISAAALEEARRPQREEEERREKKAGNLEMAVDLLAEAVLKRGTVNLSDLNTAFATSGVSVNSIEQLYYDRYKRDLYKDLLHFIHRYERDNNIGDSTGVIQQVKKLFPHRAEE